MSFLSKPTAVSLALLPVLLPATYLLLLQAVVSYHVASSTVKSRLPPKKEDSSSDGAPQPPPPPEDLSLFAPRSLPEDVLGPGAACAVFCERVVSRPVPLRDIAGAETVTTEGAPSDADRAASLLTVYLRGTMEAFSWTPQALFVRNLIADPALRRTFDADYTRALVFDQDNVCNGIYQVTYRGRGEAPTSERAELSVIPVLGHPEYHVHVLVVCEVQRSASSVVFVNETWAWRRLQGDKPTLFENRAGRWLHGLLAGWLITKGMRTVKSVKGKME